MLRQVHFKNDFEIEIYMHSYTLRAREPGVDCCLKQHSMHHKHEGTALMRRQVSIPPINDEQSITLTIDTNLVLPSLRESALLFFGTLDWDHKICSIAMLRSKISLFA